MQEVAFQRPKFHFVTLASRQISSNKHVVKFQISCRHFCKLDPATSYVPYGLVLLNWALGGREGRGRGGKGREGGGEGRGGEGRRSEIRYEYLQAKVVRCEQQLFLIKGNRKFKRLEV